MKVRTLHSWDIDYGDAVELQNQLRQQVVTEGKLQNYRLVAGADVSYSKPTNWVYAGVIVYDLKLKEPVEAATASGKSPYPYIPGLLSFREAPILLQAFRKIRTVPDVVIFDGQGIAHPRRIGLASHVGLWLDLPSVGCAKSVLVGEYEEPEHEKGAATPLVHDGEVVGMAVRTRPRVKPVYVSVGHKLDLATAVDVVLASCTHFRLPEPTRLAHLLVNRMREQEEKGRA